MLKVLTGYNHYADDIGAELFQLLHGCRRIIRLKKISFLTQAIFGIGFVVLIVFALLLLTNGKINPISSAVAFEKSTALPGDERRKNEIENLKTKIADTKMPPDTKEIVTKRLQIAEYEGTLIAQPANPHPTVVIATVNPKKSLKYEVDDGIVVVPVPYSPQSFKINNVWKGRHGNDKYMVYAGAMAKNPNQGIVIVREIGKQNPNDGTIFPTAGKFGAVEIIGYDGMILQLKSEKGDILNFDVLNGMYLEFPTATEFVITSETTPTTYP